MDIIITDEKGAGCRRTVENILHPGSGRIFAESDILYVHDAYFTPGLITEMLRAARVRAVVFDGCITAPAELLCCVAAVKEYRNQIGAHVLAIYVAPGETVVLTDGEINRPGFSDNRFRDCPPSQEVNLTAEHTQRRTDKILCDLWDTVSEKVDEEGSVAMQAQLDTLCNARVPEKAPRTCWGLHHLDTIGKHVLHGFLLDLLHKYEKTEPKPLANELTTPFSGMHLLKSYRILLALWAQVSDIIIAHPDGREDAAAMIAKANELVPGSDSPINRVHFVDKLNHQQACELREFLLTLLRKYE